MTPLRKRMIRELELQCKSPITVQAYVAAVAHLAAHYGRSPLDISLEEVRYYFHWLIVDRKLASSSCNQKLAGIRFLYHKVLRQPFDLRVPMKRSGRLPEPLSRREVPKLLQVVDNVNHRALLMTAYGAGRRPAVGRHGAARLLSGQVPGRAGDVVETAAARPATRHVFPG